VILVSNFSLLNYYGSSAVGRLFLTELNGNPNKRNARDETCLHILCSAQSQLSVEELDVRLSCVDQLLQWSGTADQTTGQNEKLDLAAVDEVSGMVV